ncbi:MAG: CcmD family protein [Bdellovibrionales bacterium]|nr:CcmD family protein [Bdellovibrionales bacterium]
MANTFSALCIAYSVIWLIIVAYLVSLTHRINKLESKKD